MQHSLIIIFIFIFITIIFSIMINERMNTFFFQKPSYAGTIQWNIKHSYDHFWFERVIQNNANNVFLNILNTQQQPQPPPSSSATTTTKAKKILFVTYENRKDLKFVELHNISIINYCKKHDGKYDYQFIPFHPNLETENVYWRKLYLLSILLNRPNTNQEYDYIAWLDSDSAIMNSDFDLQAYLATDPSKHIFIGIDGVIANQGEHVSLNSGFFILRTSQISRDFVQQCLQAHEYDKAQGHVLDSSLNIVKGNWAGIIYEQGRMNLLLGTTFRNHLHIMNNTVVLNSNNMFDFHDVFVLHLYRQRDDYRCKCFQLMK